jgi:hypothetical protein
MTRTSPIALVLSVLFLFVLTIFGAIRIHAAGRPHPHARPTASGALAPDALKSDRHLLKSLLEETE